MERIEFVITGTVSTTPITTEMSMEVDVNDMDFGSPSAGESSVVVSRILTIIGTPGTVSVKVGITDWIGREKVMAGSTTEVALNAGDYIPLVVAEEVSLGNLAAGEYTLNFRVTPPTDIDLNTYIQKIVVIGE